MRPKIAIVWFRNDLRLHDNEALSEAMAAADYVIPIYVFDLRIYSSLTRYGFEKCGNFRTKFIIESVQDLKQNLLKLGSNLLIRIGAPEDVIFEMAKKYKSSWVYCNRERTSEEVAIQDNLEIKLWSIGQELRFTRGKMLIHTADLPFPVAQTPDTFTTFRKEVESQLEVRAPLSTPTNINFPFHLEIEENRVPSLCDLGKAPVNIVHEENKNFIGGESYALKQLDYYLFKTNLIATYKQSRNELYGWDFSSKMSPWLALGCISPKLIYSKLKEYEDNVLKNESTYWLFFELLWRDFFRLMGKKHKSQIFKKCGPRQVEHTANENFELFSLWKEGRTGVPFIDACMVQLNQTGYMSNRGRQNVASFLTKDYKVNWLMGAEYFESMLIDYDPCSNYGNWNYIAGVGSDPREDRYFNIATQYKKYDPECLFVKYWLEEYKDAQPHEIHEKNTLKKYP